ncbi:MAG: DUF2237 domain-containing protein [Flammeovirgaceae bacterium]|nr:DUF2237 domain-containing protein [Flammeovirgaceae bacterium]
MDKNVFGETLIPCSMEPLTGFLRDGCCNSNDNDDGMHTICVELTTDFLEFSSSCGNDLTTPLPDFGFPGLKPGDHWCLCASRWKEAFEAGKAPLVVLEATNEKTLDIIPLDILVKYALKKAPN